MTALDAPRRSGIPAISGRRTPSERLRDRLDPLWRRLRWAVTARRLAPRHPGPTPLVRLDGPAAERANEILARRLTD